jgi:UDP-glucose 4-epimerase
MEVNINLNESYKNKVILVTGGAGFVGTNLVKKLANFDVKKIIVLDNLFTGRLENIENIKKVEFIHGDIENYDLVRDIVKECDIIFHLAARNIIVSTKDPYLDFKTNVYGTFNILEASRYSKIERLVYASSVSVYGNALYLPINEKDLLYPLNPYAASKISSESYCNTYYETYGVPVTILRYSNVYGPYQTPLNPYCGVISKFITNALNGAPLQIHGDGEQTRDFTYVEDVVDATLLAGINNKAIGETFNIATGVEITINQLADVILKITNSSSPIEYVDKRDIDNVRRRVLNIEHARRILRWTPKITLLEGIKRTIQWIREMK